MKPVSAVRWSSAGPSPVAETLAGEEPLAIEITYVRGGAPIRRRVATTMRTPGADTELALGFLFAEGLIAGAADVAALRLAEAADGNEAMACVTAELHAPPREALERVSRSLLTTSACGFCGRPTLPRVGAAQGDVRWDPAVLVRLPDALRARQPLFAATGACHGAGLANVAGELLLAREDVGRHNAVDKLLGAALAQTPAVEFAGCALVLSGRAGYELIQKAAAAGLPVVAAVGAPTALAVRIAHEAGILLAGFVREGRLTIYTGAARLHGTP